MAASWLGPRLCSLVRALRGRLLRQQFENALSRSGGSCIGRRTPGLIERAGRDGVLLGHRPDGVAFAVLDAPVDLDGLPAILHGANGDLARENAELKARLARVEAVLNGRLEKR